MLRFAAILAACCMAVPAYAATPAQKPLKVCVGINGAVTAKTKCSRLETPFTVATMRSQVSDGCRMVFASASTSTSFVEVDLNCNADEALQLWGYSISPLRLVTLRYATLNYDGDLATGVSLGIQGEINSDWAGENYTATASGMCCLRW